MACPPNADGLVVEGDCSLEQGTVLSFVSPDESVPEAAPPSTAERSAMPQPADESSNSATDAPVAEASAVDAPVAEEQATTEVPSAPTGLDADAMSKLAGAANGDSTMLVVLGVIGLAGAGTTWKFLTQWGEQRHEQKMKQLDISERASGLGAAQPPPCQAATSKLIADMDALTARIAAVEKKSMTLSADFDGEDLERQVKKLTRTVKALQDEGKN